MTQKDKELLLKDLCARLPYGVLCYINDDDTSTPRKLRRIEVDELDGILLDFWTDREDCPSMQVYLSEVKPYLRPMSSMTVEEKKEWYETFDSVYDLVHGGDPDNEDDYDDNWHKEPGIESYDYLNAHHFDYRGLIGKDLAIEAPEGMYK